MGLLTFMPVLVGIKWRAGKERRKLLHHSMALPEIKSVSHSNTEKACSVELVKD